MQEVYDRTRIAMLGLIQNSLASQKLLGSSELAARRMSTKSILNEYCTVRCCGPRRSGHSWAIYDASIELGRQGLSSAIICAMSIQDGQICRDQGPGRTFRRDSVSNLKDCPVADVIFVDNATFLGAGRRKKIEAYAICCLESRGRVVLVYVE